MANILEFRRSDRSAQSGKGNARSDEVGVRSAEIIIFPGVRIERQLEVRDTGKLPASASNRSSDKARRE